MAANDNDQEKKPATRGGLSSLLKKKDVTAKPIETDWVRVMVYMLPEDHDFYKNFYWFMKNKAGNSHWGHKELQNHLMELAKDKYGNIPERTDFEKQIEEKKSKPKIKK